MLDRMGQFMGRCCFLCLRMRIADMSSVGGCEGVGERKGTGRTVCLSL